MKTIRGSILIFLVLTGCDSNSVSEHNPEVVVESYLVANEDMPAVRLTWTAPISGRYDAAVQAIRNADVVVHLLALDGTIEISMAYLHDDAFPGVYSPAGSQTVLPTRTYRLEADVPGESDRVSAETTIPGAFEITGVSAEAVVYQGPVRYEVDVTPSVTARDQTIFVFTIEALDPDLAELTPLYLDTIYDIKRGEPYDPDSLDFSEVEPFLINASPPLNEANYDHNMDGTVTVRLPWFALVFYGEHRVSTSAIDDAIYDFMRFQQVQQGGSTLSPGEIPNVLDHVDGGRGVFGSMATVSANMSVLRQ